MKKKRKLPLNKLTDDSLRYMDTLLFFGSPFGGRSLEELLEMYKTHGPYHPVRGELQAHLQRCLVHVSEMDAFIRARAQQLPRVKNTYIPIAERRPKKRGT